MTLEYLEIWSVYIVECSDGTLYTGISNDVTKRILHHNLAKGAKYTRARLPVTLKYSEQHSDKSAALKREHAIKQLTRIQKMRLITESTNHQLPISSSIYRT